MMASWSILLLGSLLGQSLEAPLVNSRIDRVLSVVEESIVTEFDIRLEELLQRYDPIACIPLAPPQNTLLQLTEDRRVLNRLAGNRSLYLPTKGEVIARRDALKQAMGQELFESFLLTYGLGEDDLAQILTERITAEQYVERNLGRALQAEVSLDEQAWDRLYRRRFQTWMNERRQGVRIRKTTPDSP
jgi:hypothetical protein